MKLLSISFLSLLVLVTFCRTIVDLNKPNEYLWNYTIIEIAEPVGRSDFAMTYIGNNKTLIHGGQSSNSNWPMPFQVDDLWEYDVQNPSWKKLKTPVQLKPRSHHNMIYVGDGKVLLYGGFSEYTITGAEIINIKHKDTWLYNRISDSWELLHNGENSGPGHTFGHKLTFIGNNRVLLYLYQVWSEESNDYLPSSQIWEFDISNRQWGNLTQAESQTPPSTPGAVFEYLGNNEVVFVGTDGQTWIYNLISGQWINITDSNGLHPSHVGTGSYIGDNKIIMHGLLGESNEIPETWQFNGADYRWKRVWANQRFYPPKRRGHKMTYGGESKVILFGGNVDGLGRWNDTWVYSDQGLSNMVYR
jgi:hypothetical protein